MMPTTLPQKEAWTSLLHLAEVLGTTNYVILETTALLQHRIGLPAVRALYQDVVPVLRVDWITAYGHQAAVEAVLTASRKKLSLVDCVSFQTMRRHGINTAFCFDVHLAGQDFQVTP